MYRGGRFITDITSQHTGGNCVADVLRLTNGSIVVISDDVLCIYYRAADWDDGDNVEAAREIADGPFTRDEAAAIGMFIREVTVDEPDGPVSTDLLTLHDGRVIGIDSETLCLYPNRDAFGDGIADYPGEWTYDQNPPDEGCPECQRSNGPHYSGPCEHGGDAEDAENCRVEMASKRERRKGRA